MTFDVNAIILNFKEVLLNPCKSIFAVALGIVDLGISVVIVYDGKELDATYILSLESLYTFVTSDVNTLSPNSMSTDVLFALFMTLLMS